MKEARRKWCWHFEKVEKLPRAAMDYKQQAYRVRNNEVSETVNVAQLWSEKEYKDHK